MRILLGLAILCTYAFALAEKPALSPVIFRVHKVSLKESVAQIEPMQSTTFLVTWFDGDLKRQPLEHDIVHCIPWDFEHDGGHYTKLSCEGLGDVFVKQVLFSGEMK